MLIILLRFNPGKVPPWSVIYFEIFIVAFIVLMFILLFGYIRQEWKMAKKGKKMGPSLPGEDADDPWSYTQRTSRRYRNSSGR